MTRKAFILPILAALLACFVAEAQAGDKVKRVTYNNPVIRSSTPDPTIIKAKDGYFYLYGTEDMHNMPIYRSKNLVDWVFVGTAFTEATRPRNTFPSNQRMMWAPDINYVGGQYVLYYSVGTFNGGTNPCIGVATSDRPEGPFTDRGTVFSANSIGNGGCIDQFYIEDNGKKYLTFGSYQGIFLVRLTDDGYRAMPGVAKKQIIGNQMEGSYIYKKGGYYYIIGSNGNYCCGKTSQYKLIVGRSKSLEGPYVTKSGASMLNGAFDIFLMGNDYVAGPGHNAEIVEDDNGKTWITYHGYLKENDGLGRCVFIDEVKWGKDGWPYIENRGPSREAAAPYFNDAD